MPGIIDAMVKPAERIGSITINKLEGMGGAGAQGASGVNGATSSLGNPVEQVFDQIRQNAIAMPVLNAIGEAVDLNVKDGLAGMIPAENTAPAALPAPEVSAPSVAAE